MEVRTIGSLEVSVAGLGCNAFGMRVDEGAAREVVQAALEVGVTHFDTADVYGEGRSEEILGRALGTVRDRVVISTKFGAASPPTGENRGSAAWARQACEASLRRLETDYIDLYTLHWPDRETPIAETLGALADLRREGKIREIGSSNFGAGLLREAAAAAERAGTAAFSVTQGSYSLLDRRAETEIIPCCAELGLRFVPYFPLALGLLTGKYRRDEPAGEGRLANPDTSAAFPDLLTDEAFDTVEALEAYADSRGHKLTELALAWLASQPVVASVISGATSAAQARANAAATTAWRLTPEEVEEVDAMTSPEKPFVGFVPPAHQETGVR